MTESDRLPRAVFERRLRTILCSVDATDQFHVKWKNVLFHRSEESTFKVTKVWVVGSFARGALDCGDLDLLVSIDHIGGKMPPEGTVARAISRGASRVQVHVGTPVGNSSGAPFKDAHLLWTHNKRSWERALSKITLDPIAGRFDRKTDRLPLRLPQLRLYNLSEADTLIDLLDRGVLASEWRPIEDITPVPESWPLPLQKAFKRLSSPSGRETLRVLPYAMQHVSDRKGLGKVWPMRTSGTEIRCGTSMVYIGRPPLEVGRLDELSTSALVLAPHITTRGPNGVWTLMRGPRHPIHRAFDGMAAWCVADAEGTPRIVEVEEDGDSPWALNKYNQLGIFTSAAKARKARLDELDSVVELDGKALAECLGRADVVEVDGCHRLGLNVVGGKFAEASATDVESVAVWLRRVLTKRKGK